MVSMQGFNYVAEGAQWQWNGVVEDVYWYHNLQAWVELSITEIGRLLNFSAKKYLGFAVESGHLILEASMYWNIQLAIELTE
jgi:hypothetical protein